MDPPSWAYVRREGLEPPCPKDLGYNQAGQPAAHTTLGVPDGNRTR